LDVAITPFTIRKQVSEPGRASIAAPHPASTGHGSLTLRRASILHVDDDPGDRLLMREALNESRIPSDFNTASNGEELLDYLYRRGSFAPPAKISTPGLILLDLNMPRMDGFEALRVIKNDPDLKRLPVVILTTSNSPADIARSYDLGANSFVQKPSEYAGLVSLVAGLCGYWFSMVVAPPAHINSWPGTR
jgi:CheY-like chemotaxis protein